MAVKEIKDLKAKEVINFIIWDTKTYPRSGVSELKFFSSPQSNRYYSNLEQGGQLAKGYTFWIKKLGVKFLFLNTNNEIDDLKILVKTNNPVLSLYIQDKKKFEIPLDMLSGGTDIWTPNAANTFATNGLPLQFNFFELNPKIRLDGETNFYSVIEWKNLISPISADVLIRVMLLGYATRPVR